MSERVSPTATSTTTRLDVQAHAERGDYFASRLLMLANLGANELDGRAPITDATIDTAWRVLRYFLACETPGDRVRVYIGGDDELVLEQPKAPGEVTHVVTLEIRGTNILVEQAQEGDDGRWKVNIYRTRDASTGAALLDAQGEKS